MHLSLRKHNLISLSPHRKERTKYCPSDASDGGLRDFQDAPRNITTG